MIACFIRRQQNNTLRKHQEKTYFSPLQHSASVGDTANLRCLLAAGADANIPDAEGQGRTSLMW